MKTSLRILHLEDDPHEGEALERYLAGAKVPCSLTRVANRSEFSEAVGMGDFDLVVADASVPDLDGVAALKLVQSRKPRLPFVIMTGAIDEQQALGWLQNGVTDYVFKPCSAKMITILRHVLREMELRGECEELQGKFAQTQKMELLGQLTGSVVHDFNNVLGIIMGNNDYVIERLALDNPLRKNIEEIRHASKRAAALTQQLLSFSRNQTLLCTVVDLNEAISSMDKMLYRVVGESITLGIALDKKLGSIKINSGYVSQILMNLVVNARDAMPQGGRLTLATRNATVKEAEAREHPGASAGNYVVLTVTDTGTGMTDEIKAHLFEPFYTTKPSGKGTGLGLATCANILKQSNGFIEVESEPGKGTAFKIYFPRVDQPAEVAASMTKTGTLASGTETLLVVEDEVALRRVVTMALRGQGYTVLQAADGQEGLRVVREYKGQPIHMVLTDVIMPHMGGEAMVEWLKSAYPNMKTLFTSGYNDEAVARGGDPKSNFLSKPYTLSVLTRKVREILDAA